MTAVVLLEGGVCFVCSYLPVPFGPGRRYRVMGRVMRYGVMVPSGGRVMARYALWSQRRAALCVMVPARRRVMRYGAKSCMIHAGAVKKIARAPRAPRHKKCVMS